MPYAQRNAAERDRLRSEMDITPVFGTVVGGSNPSGGTADKNRHQAVLCGRVESHSGDGQNLLKRVDLTNGNFRPKTFDEAKKTFPGWICQASDIKIINDVGPEADIVSVRQYFEELARSITKISSM